MSNTTRYQTGRDYDDYFRQVRENYKAIDNPFWYYEMVIDDLLSVNNISLLPLNKFVNTDSNESILIGLRHDIDADPVSAVRSAQALSRRGVSGSFYFLHSAIYYGEFFDDIFIRNPRVIDWIKSIIVAGSEIGIHNDAIGVERTTSFNGVEHFESEINWMRSCGALITGTTAHNNFLTNNAENYEIFKEHVLFIRKQKSGFLKSIFSNQAEEDYLDIVGSTSLQKIGLSYEATFSRPLDNVSNKKIEEYNLFGNASFFNNRELAYAYFINNPIHSWSVEYQVWIIGKNQWIVAGNGINGTVFEFQIPWSKVFETIKEFKKGSKVLFVFHPEYFGGI